MRSSIRSWLGNHPNLKYVIQFLLIVLPFGFIINSLFQNWKLLETYRLDFNVFLLIISSVVLPFSLLLLPLATKTVFGALGYKLPFLSVSISYFIAQISKYLPGGVWIVPGRIIVFSQYNISKTEIGFGLGVELFFLVIAGLINSLPYFILGYEISFQHMAILSVSVVFFLVVLIRFRNSSFFLNFISEKKWFRRLKSKEIRRHVSYVLFIDLLFWVCMGIGFYFLVASLYPVGWGRIIIVSAAFSLAWVAGFLAFMTPSGLGVREGVLLILLAPFLPAPLPAAISLVARIWWLFGDIMMALTAVIVAKSLANKVR